MQLNDEAIRIDFSRSYAFRLIILHNLFQFFFCFEIKIFLSDFIEHGKRSKFQTSM